MSSWHVETAMLPNPNHVPIINTRVWPRHSVAVALFFKLVESDRDLIVLQHVCQALMLLEPVPVIQDPSSFVLPQEVVVLRDGTLVVSDRDAPGLIHVTAHGTVLRSVKMPEMLTPLGLNLNRDGSLAVCDFTNGLLFLSPDAGFTLIASEPFPLLKHVTELPNGDLVASSPASKELMIVKRGSTSFTASGITLSKPGLVRCMNGQLYVIDNGTQELIVFDVDPVSGARTRRRAFLLSAAFKLSPFTTIDGLATLPDGSVLLSEVASRCIIRMRLDSPSGSVVGVYGGRGADEQLFDYPVGMAELPYGNVIIGDRNNARLQLLNLWQP